ncbi:MAG TPA: hypothetical protein VHX39_02235, partial [Acetobacteraceae bacterium]|nr:hypothetical protein [Acetobacteraceae bacterium]
WFRDHRSVPIACLLGPFEINSDVRADACVEMCPETPAAKPLRLKKVLFQRNKRYRGAEKIPFRADGFE